MIERSSENDVGNGNVIPITLNANFFFERAVRSLDRFQYDKALKNFAKLQSMSRKIRSIIVMWRVYSQRWVIMRLRTKF